MKGLNQITFVNSASLNYSTVNLDGNTLLCGANGVGKTTILRAILYFYHANGKKVDIGSKKRGFNDYYFSSINSYLIYRYKNQHSQIYLIMYKSSIQSAIKFRFFRFNDEYKDTNIQDLIFENNTALDINSISEQIRKIGHITNTMQSAKEYRDTLYNHNKELKHYSLFNTNKEYSQIYNTISNIFINSKLDSNVIKKSLINSVENFTNIDLNQIRTNIQTILKQMSDIKVYEQNSQNIKSAIENLNLYDSNQELFQELSKVFYTQYIYSKQQYKLLDRELNILEQNIIRLDENQQNITNKFNQKERKVDNEIVIIKDFLKTIKKKKEDYQLQNIDDKIALNNNKDSLELEHKNIITKINTLQNIASNESEKFDNLIEKQKNSCEKFSIDKIKEINSKQGEFNNAKDNLLKQQNKEIQNITKEYDDKLQISIINVDDTKEYLNTLNQTLKDMKNKIYFKDEKEQLHNIKSNLKDEINKLKLSNKDDINRIDRLSNEINSLELKLENQISTLSHKTQTQKNKIDEKIKNIKSKLNINDDTFLAFLRDEKHQNSTLLSNILKDDILLNQTLEPKIVDQNNTLYGIEINQSNINTQNYDIEYLEKQLEENQAKLSQIQDEFIKQKNILQTQTDKIINKLVKEKKNINLYLTQEQKDLSKKETLYIKTKQDIQTITQQANKQKLKDIDEIEIKIKDITTKYGILKNEKINIEKQIDIKIKAIKSNYTKKENLLKDELNNFIKINNEQIEEFKQNSDTKIEELKIQKENLLSQKGIDTQALKSYEKEKEKLEATLNQIKQNYNIIIEYHKDKREYIDKAFEKTNILKTLEEKLSTLQTNFKQQIDSVEKEKGILNSKKQELNTQMNIFQENIKEFKKVEDSSFYPTISPYFDDTIKTNIYEKLDDSKLYECERSIISFKNKLHKALNVIFDKISQDNVLNITPPQSVNDKYILKSARKLKKFEDDNQIKFFKDSLSSTYSQTLNHYSKDIGALLDAQGIIQKNINKITNKLKDLKNIKVIEKVELRYAPTQDKAVQLLIQLKTLYDENSFQADTNLFNQLGANDDFNQKVLKIFEYLNEYLYENSKKEYLKLDDSFLLEFRAIENGNDTKFQPMLDNIGSNGTDVMIKVMVYITMLNLALEQSLNKNNKDEEFYLHCILDEVGILSPKYLKELIEFANSQNIRFINGAPDEKIIQSYKRIYMLRTTQAHKTLVNQIVAQVC